MNLYLKKYGFQPTKIRPILDPELWMIIVIPCHNEQFITRTLDSLMAAKEPDCRVLIIVVVNQSEQANEEIKNQNSKSIAELKAWQRENSSFFYLEIMEELNLPKKHAGVGLARKIGMDEAVELFHNIDNNGIIVALDADCQVEPNYLVEIEKHFVTNSKTPGCSIRYAHPIVGVEFAKEIYTGIIQYELHLRYYNQAMKYVGFPYAFHTVGSSMAVRSSAYQKQGGMNKRKAGEDFYFLQKIIELGNFTELNSTCVIPSPRISDRVPFGTGKAIGDWIDKEDTQFMTYSLDSFLALKTLNEDLLIIYEKEDYTSNLKVLNEFLLSIDFKNKIKEIKHNTTNYLNFEKRFYRYINAFAVLKFVHFARDNYFPNEPVKKESIKLLSTLLKEHYHEKSEKDLLELYRTLEKGAGLVV